MTTRDQKRTGYLVRDAPADVVRTRKSWPPPSPSSAPPSSTTGRSPILPGSTEAALVAVVVAAHVPLAHAIEQVMIFRLITFWTPAVIGLFVSRRVNRNGAL